MALSKLKSLKIWPTVYASPRNAIISYTHHSKKLLGNLNDGFEGVLLLKKATAPFSSKNILSWKNECRELEFSCLQLSLTLSFFLNLSFLPSLSLFSYLCLCLSLPLSPSLPHSISVSISSFPSPYPSVSLSTNSPPALYVVGAGRTATVVCSWPSSRQQ